MPILSAVKHPSTLLNITINQNSRFRFVWYIYLKVHIIFFDATCDEEIIVVFLPVVAVYAPKLEIPMYDAENHLNLLKQQAKCLYPIINNFKNTYLNNNNEKMIKCSNLSKVINNRITSHSSCNVNYCPICSVIRKPRKEIAINYKLIDMINADDNEYNIKLLTLTTIKTKPNNLLDNLKKLKSNVDILMKSKLIKTPSKIVSLNEQLLGSSIYHHLSSSNDYANNNTMGFHSHIILLLDKKKSMGRNFITKKMINDKWNSLFNTELIISYDNKPIDAIPNMSGYGKNNLDFDSFVKYPDKLESFIDNIKGNHLMKHGGIVSTYRKSIEYDFKNNSGVDIILPDNTYDDIEKYNQEYSMFD